MEHTFETPVTKLVIPDDMVRLQKPIFGGKQGQFVKVRRAKEGAKTQLGLYLGDLPLGIVGGIQRDDPSTFHIQYGTANPAIFVFEENQIVYGCESWWGTIKNPDELKEITDGDIQNVWYVQALKQLTEKDAAAG